ncbi:MAG: DUF3313 family protein [Halioglobus sp.]
MNKFFVLLLSGVFLVACASTKPEPVSQDGLLLQNDTKFQEVYLLPGADLSTYQSIGLEACSVSFRKNWLRDQNNSRLDLSSRVTQKDVDGIKDALGDACNDQFSKALLATPAYDIVDQFDDGEAVLIVRPAIINLDINAPDTMSVGVTRSYTTTAGEMTLALELVDGTTGQVLARARDRRRSPEYGTLQWTSGVTNKADADRSLKRWAGILRDGLDEATGR